MRFNGNRYSGANRSRCSPLWPTTRTVRLVNGIHTVAEHYRAWGKKQILEKPEHRAVLVAERKAAAQFKGRDRLRAVAPTFDRIVERWTSAAAAPRCASPAAIKLLDLYGDQVFAGAVKEVVGPRPL